MFLLSACAVSAMLCEVAGSGVSSRVKSGDVDEEEMKGDPEFDVVLSQSELTERALQLSHLLPPGFIPVSGNRYHSSKPLCLIHWMFNRANQPFILLRCLHLGQLDAANCVWLCMYMCSITLSLSSASEPKMPFLLLSTPTHHFISCSFLSPQLAGMLVTPFLTGRYHPSSRPCASSLRVL